MYHVINRYTGLAVLSTKDQTKAKELADSNVDYKIVLKLPMGG